MSLDLNSLLQNAGPYTIVFIGMAGVIVWLLKERSRILQALEDSTERLLEERQKRADDNLESAKLLASCSDAIRNSLADHDKTLEKAMVRWDSSTA